MPKRRCSKRASRPPGIRRARNQRRSARYLVPVESDHAAVDLERWITLHDHAMIVSRYRARAAVSNACNGLAHHAIPACASDDLATMSCAVTLPDYTSHLVLSTNLTRNIFELPWLSAGYGTGAKNYRDQEHHPSMCPEKPSICWMPRSRCAPVDQIDNPRQNDSPDTGHAGVNQ
ncbi:hypothetical protein RSK60_1160027 [Ralstonia solanacearum K60]|nr:hypothetical protein RSK60_1160027 [Ralstonia solanacearum K60]